MGHLLAAQHISKRMIVSTPDQVEIICHIRIMAHNLSQDAGADLERIPIPGAQPVYSRVSGTAFGIESPSKRLWI